MSTQINPFHQGATIKSSGDPACLAEGKCLRTINGSIHYGGAGHPHGGFSASGQAPSYCCGNSSLFTMSNVKYGLMGHDTATNVHALRGPIPFI